MQRLLDEGANESPSRKACARRVLSRVMRALHGLHAQPYRACCRPYRQPRARLYGRRRRLRRVRRTLADDHATVKLTAIAQRGNNSPLVMASSRGALGCMRVLLAAGAGVEACDQLGGTALFVAAYNGHADAVALLLEQCAAPDATESVRAASRPARHPCADDSDSRALLDYAQSGRCALHVAVKADHTAVVMALLCGGAVVNTPDLVRDGGSSARASPRPPSHACRIGCGLRR
jgi:hypothetical protein